MPAKKVLSLGQCAADHYAISQAIRQHFDAEVVAAHTFAEALTHLREQPFDLVLVNRILDLDGASGLDFIKKVHADPAAPQPPVMLVSNYEEYQTQAVSRGALPGFGKASLQQPQTIERLRTVLG